MKIACLTDTYHPEINGVVTSVLNFTRNLAQAGHQILIIAPKYDRKQDPKTANITVKRYPSFSFASNKETRLAYPSAISIVNNLRDFKPDLIHVQTPMAIGMAGVMAAKILGLKLVQTYHTYIPEFMVYLSPYNLLGVDKAANRIASSKVMRKIIESDAYRLLDETSIDIQKRSFFVRSINKLAEHLRGEEHTFSDKVAWDFTRFIYNKSDLVITPSQALADVLVGHGLKAPVHVLSNGIEFHEIEKKQDYRIGHRMIHVGRLGLEKGTDVVVRGLAEALKTNPALTLDIGGDGPAMAKLVNLTRTLGLEKSINFLGFVPREVLKQQLMQYDFFVTASTIETQGLVILEAMAAGLPVIGVNALAVPELVYDNQNGCLVETEDYRAMGAAMLRLSEDPRQNEAFGRFSMMIAEKHDLPHCADRLEKIYMELLAAPLNQVIRASHRPAVPIGAARAGKQVEETKNPLSPPAGGK